MTNKRKNNHQIKMDFKKPTRKQLAIGGGIGVVLLLVVLITALVISAKDYDPTLDNVGNNVLDDMDEQNQDDDEVSIKANDPAATTTFVSVDGKDYKQIRIPVACNISPNEYTVDTSGYLRDGAGEKATGTLATTGGTSKYITYGSLGCITDSTTLKYNLPDGYSIRGGLGGAYHIDDDEQAKTLSVHIEHLSVFADGSVGYAMTSDYQYGKRINILDENNDTVDVYYIKLNPQVTSNTGVQFLNDWKSAIDSKKSYSSSSSSPSSSSSSSYSGRTDWEAYCRDVFPGNDSYNRAARESCVRSAQASENMASGKYNR